MTRIFTLFCVLTLTLMNLPVQAETPALVADTIIVNAIVHTMDPAHPTAEAVAIYGNRIVAVGSSKDIKKLAGSGTRTIDAKKQLVLPGFNDAHTHFLTGGFQLASVDLRGATSREDFARRLAEFAKTLPPGRWITGGDWDHEAWGGELPWTLWIDEAAGDHPVFVNRLDGHMALANTKALELAGITRDTPDPPGGSIV